MRDLVHHVLADRSEIYVLIHCYMAASASYLILHAIQADEPVQLAVGPGSTLAQLVAEVQLL